MLKEKEWAEKDSKKTEKLEFSKEMKLSEEMELLEGMGLSEAIEIAEEKSVSQKVWESLEEIEHVMRQLQASIEELELRNRALQSSNKKLIASKQELQHINQEYQQKISELVIGNLDFDNLLVNAQIGALYIDNELHIRKITPIMEQNTLLFSADVGRCVEYVRFMNQYLNFAEDVKTCMEKEIVIEKEVISGEGITWLIRIRPYYNMEGKNEGVLVVLFDITKRLEAAKYELELITNNVPGAVSKMRYDNGLIVEYANEGMYQMMNLTKEQFALRYRNYYDRMVLPADWAMMRQQIEAAVKTRKQLRLEYRVALSDGSICWRMMQAMLLEERSAPILQCIILDITDQKENLDRIWQEQEKLHAIAEMSADLIFEYDICNDWMHYSNNRVDIIGQEMITEKYSKNIISSGLIYQEDLPVIQEFCKALKEGRPEIKLEVRKKYADGIFHWSSIHAKTLYNQDGKPVRVVGTTSNIDERKLKEEKLKKRSERDSLTNLYNHMTIKTLIDEQLKKQLKKEKLKGKKEKQKAKSKERKIESREKQEAWLLVMDVDNFKQVNDSQGHLYGDAVLCSFADELNHVFESPFTGRIGGDEFCVLAVGETKESICEKMKLLNQRIRKMCSSEGSEISISSSIGAAKYQPEKYEYDLLFQQADSALYYVKNHGKCGYQIYDPILCKMDKKEGLWYNYEDNTMRRDALFADEQDLLVFSIELLERVNDVQNAMKVICDRICRFFHLDDMIIIEKNKWEELEVHYRFSRFEERNGVKEANSEKLKNLKQICSIKEEETIRIWNKEALKQVDPTMGNTSLLCIALDKDILPEGYVIFWDRKKDHDWLSCTGILNRLANILSSRLLQYYENKKREERFAFIESYDSLTQLPNYKKFLALSEEYRKEHPEKKFFCTYSDFSNFQYLNEIYGFSMGNEVLYGFAAALRERCEGIVYASHINADHFLVLHEGENIHRICHSFEEMTKKYCEELRQLYPLCNLLLVSGISEVKPEDCDITYYIDNANVARKTAKGRGETCCVEFADNMKRQMEQQMERNVSMQK